MARDRAHHSTAFSYGPDTFATLATIATNLEGHRNTRPVTRTAMPLGNRSPWAPDSRVSGRTCRPETSPTLLGHVPLGHLPNLVGLCLVFACSNHMTGSSLQQEATAVSHSCVSATYPPESRSGRLPPTLHHACLRRRLYINPPESTGAAIVLCTWMETLA